MSTLWWELRVAEVYSIESDPGWSHKVTKMSLGRAHIQVRQEPSEYAESILSFPVSYFDVVVIDGINRRNCFLHAMSRLKPGGYLVVDNTDMDQENRGDIFQIDLQLKQDQNFEVWRFPGWVPGRLSPQETTICRYLQQ